MDPFGDGTLGPSSNRTNESLLVRVLSLPNHKIIDPLRELATAVVQARYTSIVAQHVGLAANELVENAVLYGTLDAEVDFALSFDPSVKHLCVRVANSTLPSRAVVVKGLIEKMRSGGARQAVEEGLRSASRGVGRSQLGLARVMYEASMELSVEVVAARVTVTARYRV